MYKAKDDEDDQSTASAHTHTYTKQKQANYYIPHLLLCYHSSGAISWIYILSNLIQFMTLHAMILISFSKLLPFCCSCCRRHRHLFVFPWVHCTLYCKEMAFSGVVSQKKNFFFRLWEAKPRAEKFLRCKRGWSWWRFWCYRNATAHIVTIIR